jgi:exopolysaccharide biosynthesis protein
MRIRGALVVVALVFAASVAAGDVRTQVRPGIELLHRTTTNPAQDIWAARIDLTDPKVGLHASADRRGTEWAVTTPAFARNTGSVVAINGDWSDITSSGDARLRPMGLAIADGAMWNTHRPTADISATWGFFACTVDKRCTAGSELPLDQAWWFGDPTKRPYRYFQAIGANAYVLVKNGAAQGGCYDTQRAPRSAIGVEANGRHLWMVVIDGRRASSGAAGMTCDEVRALMLDLGNHDAVMLDGGGSSTMVVDNVVKNQPSDGAPRTVGNHFGITYADAVDPRCDEPSGRFCNGSVIATCQGGRFLGSGDCAAFGTTCQEDGAFAFCVHPDCPDDDGLGAACVDDTRIRTCSDGVPGTGDCGVFGLACGSDDGGAACTDPRCSAGPHSSFCTASGALATCTNGTYDEHACGTGTACVDDGGAAGCALPGSEGEGEGEGEGEDEDNVSGEGEGERELVAEGEGDGGVLATQPPPSTSSASCGQGASAPVVFVGVLLAAGLRRQRRRDTR